MKLRDVLRETEEAKRNLRRYIEATENEDPETAPELAVYLPLTPSISSLFTKERIRLLRYVAGHSGITVGELAQALGRSVDVVSRDLGYLTSFEVITIERSQTDARQKIVRAATGEIRVPLVAL